MKSAGGRRSVTTVAFLSVSGVFVHECIGVLLLLPVKINRKCGPVRLRRRHISCSFFFHKQDVLLQCDDTFSLFFLFFQAPLTRFHLKLLYNLYNRLPPVRKFAWPRRKAMPRPRESASCTSRATPSNATSRSTLFAPTPRWEQGSSRSLYLSRVCAAFRGSRPFFCFAVVFCWCHRN